MGDLFFINIENAGEVRRNLLESEKVIIECFKHYEQYKKIKQERLEKMRTLQELIVEVRQANEHLREVLPDVKVKIKPAPQVNAEKVLPQFTQVQLERLEDDLSSIEEDLKKLGTR